MQNRSNGQASGAGFALRLEARARCSLARKRDRLASQRVCCEIMRISAASLISETATSRDSRSDRAFSAARASHHQADRERRLVGADGTCANSRADR